MVVHRTARRLTAPAVIGVSAAALAQFVPGVAVAAAHQASQHAAKTDSGQQPDAAAGPSTSATPATPTTGCDEGSSPSYGCGKISVEAQPVASTFPADALPDVSGLTLQITGPISDNDVIYPVATNTCVTGESGSASSDECTESIFGETTDSHQGPWDAGGQYTIALARAFHAGDGVGVDSAS
jgi:hypothetical protein